MKQTDNTLELEQLKQMLRDSGVHKLFLKQLAPNDNSKNQIYLGPDLETVNILPSGELSEEWSGKNLILKAPLAFSWLGKDGKRHPAKGAQLILYPQYPEVRMSGLLKGCSEAPSHLMASRDSGRIILLGVTSGGEIVAWAGDGYGPVAKALAGAGELSRVGIFFEVPLFEADSRLTLLRELRRIHMRGWINSKRLRSDGAEGPCNAPNCGGYTLEAELGITPNGFSEPDFLGWEIKQHGVTSFDRPSSGSPITLMTPEPNGGIYKEQGPEAFIRRFGYQDMRGRADRLNFGGVYRAGIEVEKTGIVLVLDGYSPETNRITDITQGIALIGKGDVVAATWSYKGLLEHWKRKHERAAYVPSENRVDPTRQYRYGKEILLGEGADFLRLLHAIATGLVYYDPGIKLEGASLEHGRVKRRSQFRIKWRDIPALYSSHSVVSLLE